MVDMRKFFVNHVLTVIVGATIAMSSLPSAYAEGGVHLSPTSTDILQPVDENLILNDKEDVIIRSDDAWQKTEKYVTNGYACSDDRYIAYCGFNLARIDPEVIFSLIDDDLIYLNYIESDTIASALLTNSLNIFLFSGYTGSQRAVDKAIKTGVSEDKMPEVMPFEEWFVSVEDYDEFMEVAEGELKYQDTILAKNIEDCDIDSLEKFIERYEAAINTAIAENDMNSICRLYSIGFRAVNDASTPLTTVSTMSIVNNMYNTKEVFPNGKQQTAPIEKWKLKKDLSKLSAKEKIVYRLANAKIKIGKLNKRLEPFIKKLDETLRVAYEKHQNDKDKDK